MKRSLVIFLASTTILCLSLSCKMFNLDQNTDNTHASQAQGERFANGAGQALPDDGKPRDYGDLPEAIAREWRSCEENGRFYELDTGACTSVTLVDYPCNLRVLLTPGSWYLTTPQKEKLKAYVAKELVGYKLYACTSDRETPVFHFYQRDGGSVKVIHIKVHST